MMTNKTLKAAAVIAVTIAMTASAHATQFPEKNIVIVTPFNAGGGSDILARVVGQKMSKTLGKDIIVENKPGAAGTIGTDYVSRAKPDGYTLLLVNTVAHTTAARMTPGVRYDPSKNFVGVGAVGDTPMLLIGRPDLADDYKSLFAKIKESPGKFTFASAGIGHSTHLVMERFKSLAGVDMKHIPYNGGNPAVSAVVSGTVNLQFENATAAELLKAGKLKGFATTGDKRSEFFPDVPTFSELGQKGFDDVAAHYGLVAPAGTPREAIEKINAALNEALKEPEVKEALGRQLVTPKPGSADVYNDQLRKDDEVWTEVIKSTNAASAANAKQ
jgi:tripartite-type tricarboxylate transporter receptor subunit TctC